MFKTIKITEILSRLKELEEFIKLEARNEKKPTIRCPFGEFVDKYMIVERTKPEDLSTHCSEETLSHSSRNCPYRRWGCCEDGDIETNSGNSDAFCRRIMEKHVKEEGPII